VFDYRTRAGEKVQKIAGDSKRKPTGEVVQLMMARTPLGRGKKVVAGEKGGEKAAKNKGKPKRGRFRTQPRPDETELTLV